MHKDFHFSGPSLEAGPLPAVFYFALSAKDSLTLDPFNQPVSFLSQFPLRIFSMDLPFHTPEEPPTEAMRGWANALAQGDNLIAPFIEKVAQMIQKLIHQNIILPQRIGVCGLSRGGFIATHVAASISEVRAILGFSPVTTLSSLREFENLERNSLIHSLDLHACIPQLIDRPLRFYIGNRDVRVGTRRCFEFIEALTEANFQSKIRSPHVEMVISPSIGHHGHGTSQIIFHQGAAWLAKELGVLDAS